MQHQRNIAIILLLASTAIGQLRVGQSLYVGLPLPPPGPTAPCALTNGLAGYWSFDWVYTDSSGQGNTLTPGAGTGFANGGYIHGAMDDATGLGATISDNATLHFGGGSFSLSCWVNAANTGYGNILVKGDGVHSTFWIYINTTDFEFVIDDGGANSSTVKTLVNGTPQTATWYHLAAIYDSVAQTINIYQNGVSNVPVSFPHAAGANSGPFQVGVYNGGVYNFVGAIDEVVAWTNRALTPLEVGLVYTNSLLGRTPLNYCSSVARRDTLIWNGDARFSGGGSDTNLPPWFQDYALLSTSSWYSNHAPLVVLYSGGSPPPTPPNVEQIEELTNNTMKAAVLAYVGAGTNVYWFTEIGINNIYIMTNGPLYGYWTAATIGLQLTNYFHTLSAAGVRVVPFSIFPFIGLQDAGGDGTLGNAELVRQRVNVILGDASASYFGYLNAEPWLTTNHVPPYWTTDPSEQSDAGNTNIAVHLNTLMNSIAP